MTDYYQRVSDEQDFFKKILGKIPGFDGYVERSNRRQADKLLRDTVGSSLREFNGRVFLNCSAILSQKVRSN